MFRSSVHTDQKSVSDSGLKSFPVSQWLGNPKEQSVIKKLSELKPYKSLLLARVQSSDKELFFDIEVDPWREFCYLHGFVSAFS